LEEPLKKIVLILSLTVSSIAVSGAYTSADASKMNGKGGMCSDGANCMANKYQNAAAGKKPHMAKPKNGN
jgi:hypothetical protein